MEQQVRRLSHLPGDLIGKLLSELPSRQLGMGALRRAVHLGREEPALLAGILKEALRALPDGGMFMDVLLGFLPEAEWPALVAAAVERLTWHPGNEAAAQVIRQAAFQIPAAVHPHLEVIFALERREQHCLRAAFHEARLEDVRFLFDLCRGASGPELKRACRALLETRLPEAIELVRTRGVPGVDPLSVGFEAGAGGLRRLYPERPLHLAFPAEYLDRLPSEVTQRDLGISHFSWTPLAPDARPPHRLGGLTGADCAICGERVARLLLLDPVPAGLGVTGLDRLEIGACLSCLGWEREILHYQHPHGHLGGRPEPEAPRRGAGVERRAPAVLAECAVDLVDLGPRARFQDWSTRENLHRVGGHPLWLEDAHYPLCPGCGARSSFLMQLDSELLTTGAESWLWGQGGLCYVHWCDPCRISTVFWECT